MLARLDPGSAAARRGLSDISIRNLFIVPTIVFLIVFNIFPLIYSLGYSFTDFRASSSEAANFVGLQNYRELLSDPYVWNNFTITAKYVLVSVGGQVLVGFGVALLLNRKVPFKGLVTTLLLLPMMMSMAVVGLFWQLLYSPSWGIINYALGLEDFEWLSDAEVALYAVALTDIWMWSPFVMLLSLAGLSAVPQHLYEAARVDGVPAHARFLHITLPLLRPSIFLCIVVGILNSFTSFDLVYVMTNGGPGHATELLITWIYKAGFGQSRFDYAAALTVVQFLLLVVLTVIANKLSGGNAGSLER